MSRPKFHVGRGDTVQVISGNHRGSSGKILNLIAAKEQVIIEGVRMIKKHQRKSQDNPNGAIIQREGPIHISNVKLVEVAPQESRKRRRRKRKRPRRNNHGYYFTRPEMLNEYKTRVVPALREKHGYKNVNEIPKIAKVVVNTSIGAGSDSKESSRNCPSRKSAHHRPASHHHSFEEKHRELQAPPGPGHRRESDPPRSHHV